MEDARSGRKDVSYLAAAHAPRLPALVVAVLVSSTLLGGVVTLLGTPGAASTVAPIDAARAPSSIVA